MAFMHLIRSAAAAGAIFLAVGACGGDEDDTAEAPGAGGTTTSQPAAAGTATDKIEVKDFSFKPDPVTVKAGTTVTWTFADSAAHNVEGVGPGSELKKSPDLKAGGTYPFTFTKAGTYDYRCGIHNSMTGKVVVTA